VDKPDSKIYSFDISATELCTYTLPLDDIKAGSSQSFYILADQGKLWIANRGNQRIYRLDSSDNQATFWQIPDPAARPVGIALDGQGGLWWADEGLGALARLDLNTTPNQMIRYDLPNPAKPNMILVQDNAVWYTAAANGSPGYLGVYTLSRPAGRSAL